MGLIFPQCARVSKVDLNPALSYNVMQCNVLWQKYSVVGDYRLLQGALHNSCSKKDKLNK